jgi:ribosomal protein S18 acetylase RimI-like enzyme
MRGLDEDVEIGAARFPDERAPIEALMRAYAASLSVDLCFQGFEEELAGLPGAYAPPRGRLLVARRSGRVVGCIALRPLVDDTCEMKRLFVPPEERGERLGERLVAAILGEARAARYRRIFLDTLPEMATAQRLYERLGFRDVGPYTVNPVPGARYLARDL